eukprot:scaffold1719_cov186-Amphora_coffeaeformis.AAC.6
MARHLIAMVYESRRGSRGASAVAVATRLRGRSENADPLFVGRVFYRSLRGWARDANHPLTPPFEPPANGSCHKKVYEWFFYTRSKESSSSLGETGKWNKAVTSAFVLM